MKIKIEIGGNPGKGISLVDLREIAAKTIKSADFRKYSDKKIAINIAFVGEKEIRKINHEFRTKDEATDVLSFSYLESKGEIKEEKLFLGELFICLPYIRQAARLSRTLFDQQFLYVLSHGILHLLGWKHGKEMYAIQDKIAGKFSD